MAPGGQKLAEPCSNMTLAERTAVAILKAGRSYDEATKVTGVPYGRLVKLYPHPSVGRNKQ